MKTAGLPVLVLAVAALAGSVAAQPAADPLAAGRALVRAGQLDEAVAAYTRILDATPDALEARKERPRPRLARPARGSPGRLRSGAGGHAA